MIIPGYLDGYEPPFAHSPLADGSELMAADLFWPTFLAMVGASSSAPDAFGADPADLEEIAEALLDERRWPVFTLPAAGASRVHVVMRNFPGEGGVDYVLDPGTGGDALPLADLDGHFRGPALSWPELIAVAGQQRDRSERLLLLLPACTDRDRPGDAVEVVTAALTEVGAGFGARRVAEELLGGAHLWPRDCGWTAVGDALVCDGAYAYRTSGGKLSRSDLRLITEALS